MVQRPARDRDEPVTRFRHDPRFHAIGAAEEADLRAIVQRVGERDGGIEVTARAARRKGDAHTFREEDSACGGVRRS